MSGIHIHAAQLHYSDLIAESAQERLATQARRTMTTGVVVAPRRFFLRGGAGTTARRALAALFAGAVVPATR